MDRISELWPELEAQGVDLRPELGRWETLHAVLRHHAAALVRGMKAAGGLPAVRAQHHSRDQAAWWWFLDEQVRSRTPPAPGAGGRHPGQYGGGRGIAVLHPVPRAFPCGSELVAVLDAQSTGERKIASQGDYGGALADFRRAAELQPEDAEAWLRVGCTSLKLGDAAAAEESFSRARALLADDVALQLARAPICTDAGPSRHC